MRAAGRPGSVLLLVLLPSLAWAQDSRTIPIAHDRFGSTAPGRSVETATADLRVSDKVRIEFHSAQVVDPGAIPVPLISDLEKRGAADGSQAFVYPADPGVLKGQASAQFRQIPIGTTTFYAMAHRSDARLRITRMSSADAEAAIQDAAAFEAFRAKQVKQCYTLNEPSVGAQAIRRSPGKELQEKLGSYTLLAFERVAIAAPPADTPYVLIELLYSSDTPVNCADTTMKGPLFRAMAVTVAKVAPEVKDAPYVRIVNGLVSTDNNMDSIPGTAGAWAFVSKALSLGEFDYRVCYHTEKGVSQSAGLIEACIPRDPVHLVVRSGLPSRIRLQPGVFAVNQMRDVRLSINLVFITKPSSYFGRGRRPLWGGTFNPQVGFQLGGSTNQIVLLMGLHARLIDEAGLVGGFRFGNETSSTPFQWRTNWYFGISLDPPLFDLLNNRRTSNGTNP